ncbi:MAG TPA: GNAT family N-acetyltransferase [Chloroflexia bacterium]|nr:GNAT family N-acetyltransferase [Chloroflexia bacterium]
MSQIINFEKVITLPAGEQVRLRFLQKEDAESLGEYLRSLSAESKGRFGPHAFDQATVAQICNNLNPLESLRVIALTDNATPKVIGYMILVMGVSEAEKVRYNQLGLSLNSQTDATFAPSIADDYQNKKLGSAMMVYLVEVAQQIGLKHLVLMGGTQATNPRAIHFYEKFGFKKVGEFEYNNLNNYDMILTL